MKSILIILVYGFCLTGCCIEHKAKIKMSDSEKVQETLPPQNVDQAVCELTKILSEADIRDIKTRRESEMWRYHYNLGLGIRNKWLIKNSPLNSFFVQHGIYERDEMSNIVLVSFWRSLHDLPINFQEQISQYKLAHPNN
jgi:hypothetical protein